MERNREWLFDATLRVYIKVGKWRGDPSLSVFLQILGHRLVHDVLQGHLFFDGE